MPFPKSWSLMGSQTQRSAEPSNEVSVPVESLQPKGDSNKPSAGEFGEFVLKFVYEVEPVRNRLERSALAFSQGQKPEYLRTRVCRCVWLMCVCLCFTSILFAITKEFHFGDTPTETPRLDTDHHSQSQ